MAETSNVEKGSLQKWLHKSVATCSKPQKSVDSTVVPSNCQETVPETPRKSNWFLRWLLNLRTPRQAESCFCPFSTWKILWLCKNCETYVLTSWRWTSLLEDWTFEFSAANPKKISKVGTSEAPFLTHHRDGLAKIQYIKTSKHVESLTIPLPNIELGITWSTFFDCSSVKFGLW